jgi:hypothetical protein
VPYLGSIDIEEDLGQSQNDRGVDSQSEQAKGKTKSDVELVSSESDDERPEVEIEGS